MLVNAMEVEIDFTYLGRKFERGDVLEFPSKYLIVMSRVTPDATEMQAFQLGAYADPISDEYYDIVRFVFENERYLSLIKFRK